MAIVIKGERKPVGTVPDVIFSFHVADLKSVLIRAHGNIDVGMHAVGQGFALDAGQAIAITHLDFTDEDRKKNDFIRIHAVAAAATTVSILQIRRD